MFYFVGTVKVEYVNIFSAPAALLCTNKVEDNYNYKMNNFWAVSRDRSCLWNNYQRCRRSSHEASLKFMLIIHDVQQSVRKSRKL